MSEGSAALFDELVQVAARALGSSVAPFTMSRLLLRARVWDRQAMTIEEARRAMPVLEAGLAEFLSPAELRTTLDAFAAVLDRRSGGMPPPSATAGLAGRGEVASGVRPSPRGDPTTRSLILHRSWRVTLHPA